MKRLLIKQCKHCQQVKQFSTWVQMPVEVQYAINAGEIEVIETICPGCIEGASNRLLPVADTP